MNDPISDRLKKLILSIEPNIDFSNNLDQQISSIQIAFLLNEIEREFSISISTAELIFLTSISFNDLNSLIHRKMNKDAQ